MTRDVDIASHWGWLQWLAMLQAKRDAMMPPGRLWGFGSAGEDKAEWRSVVCRDLDAGRPVAVAAFEELECAGSYRRSGRLVRNGDWVWFVRGDR